jgi:hypothetical protein
MGQIRNVSMLAMAVVALEATRPIVLIAWFEIHGAGLILVGVFMNPRADDAVASSDAR